MRRARRREQAQREARVLRWREDAGTAALCGRDLPPAEVLAADQRISARARELKAAGLAGTMDELRARAYLDFLLGRNGGLPAPGTSDPAAAEPVESAARPDRPDARPAGPDTGPDRRDGGTGGPARGPGGPYAGAGGRGTGAGGAATGPWPPGGPPGGLAARINVTVPLSTLLGTSGTPAEVAAFGPVDAELARELARAAGMHPATRWCVTVVGQHGQAVGHGCAPAGTAAPGHPSTGPDGPARNGPAPDAPDRIIQRPTARDRMIRYGRGATQDGPRWIGPARDRPANGRAVPAEQLDPLNPLNPLARAFLQRLRDPDHPAGRGHV